MAEKAEIVKMLTVLAALYPSYKGTEQTYEVYADLLKDLDGDLLAAAIRQCAAECEFYPTAAAIRKKALELRKMALADGAPTAQEAWAEALKRADYYHTPSYSHPRVEEAVRLIGGHRMLALAERDELISHRARFMEVYASLEDRERTEQAMLPDVRGAVAKMQEIAAKQRLALGVDDE